MFLSIFRIYDSMGSCLCDVTAFILKNKHIEIKTKNSTKSLY